MKTSMDRFNSKVKGIEEKMWIFRRIIEMTKCEQQREKNWTNEFVSASGTYVTITNNLAFKSSKSHKEKRKKIDYKSIQRNNG